jgi:hypothetical protein
MPTQTWSLTPWGNFGDHQITIEIDPAEVVGVRSVLGSALLFRFKCTPDLWGDPAVRLHALEGWIAAGSESVVLCGIRIPSQTIYHDQMTVPITDEEIAAIEKGRTDDAAIFRISLMGLATFPNPNHTMEQYVRQADGKMAPDSSHRPDVRAVRDQNGDGGQLLRIEREHWLKILEQLGAGKRRLIELPEPTLPVGQATWAECIRLLSEATQLFPRGQYPQVLSACRTIIEGVTVVLCAHWGVVKDPKTSFNTWSRELPTHLAVLWKSDADSAKMFYALLQAGWTWASQSHHSGSGFPEREEVSFALSLATDLVVFGAQVLTAHSALLADQT